MTAKVEVLLASFIEACLEDRIRYAEIEQSAKRALIKSSYCRKLGNQSAIARQTGIHRNTIARHLAEMVLPALPPRTEPKRETAPIDTRARKAGAA